MYYTCLTSLRKKSGQFHLQDLQHCINVTDTIRKLKSVHVDYDLVIVLHVFTCKITIDNVWGKLNTMGLVVTKLF